jgi:hypothetical protein
MKLSSKPLGIIILVILFGSISVTTATGWWQTTNTKQPARYSEGEAAGQYNPADIRGSYTFGEISDLFDIPIEDLKIAFRLPEDSNPAQYQVKNLEELYETLDTEIGTSSVRLFVALYKGFPYDLTEDVYLLNDAVEPLKQSDKMSPEQSIYLENHTINLNNSDRPIKAPFPQDETLAVPTAAPTSVPEHSSGERIIRGTTTFQDLLDWGVSQPVIEEIIGGPLPDSQTPIKDYATAQGLEFGTIKATLQAEVDKINP